MELRRTSLIFGAILLSAIGFSAWAEPPESTSLEADEIQRAFVGKRIRYNPPGWADTTISEWFYPDGRWGGILSGRGPIRFSGQWSIRGDKICVTADEGTFAKRWHSGKFCRAVWKGRKDCALSIEYLANHTFGLQTIAVFDLTTTK
jgi:hypothetical protein